MSTLSSEIHGWGGLFRYCFGRGSLTPFLSKRRTKSVLRAKPDRAQNHSKPYSERIQTIHKTVKTVPNLQSNRECSPFGFLGAYKMKLIKTGKFRMWNCSWVLKRGTFLNLKQLDRKTTRSQPSFCLHSLSRDGENPYPQDVYVFFATVFDGMAPSS